MISDPKMTYLEKKSMPWESLPDILRRKTLKRFQRDREKLLTGSTEGVECRRLPYGVWTCSSGRKVLFDRRYIALLEMFETTVRVADPSEWVREITHETWLYNREPEREKRAKVRATLREWLALPRS